MKKMHKRICLFLALLMTASLFAGCGEAAGDETTADTAAEVVETEAETDELEARKAIPDDLPDMDFGGYEFRILTYSPKTYEVEELTGDVVDDTKYDRQMYISETYNAEIKAATSAGIAELDAELRAAVTAGDDAYDIAIPHQITSGPGFITSNLILDWNTVPYINMEKPWWNQRINETINIMNKQFYIAGYISMPAPFCMFVNKAYMEDYGYGDIYSIVREKKWTFDMLTEMAVATTMDLNGDGEMTPDADQYGITCNNDNMTLNFMYSSGVLSVLIDDEGKPVPNTYNDKMLSLVEGVYYLVHESQTCIYDDYNTQDTVGRPAFAEGRVMFRTGEVHELSKFRDSELDIGLIPYPMWDETQGYYATHVDAWNGMLCIPVTATDPERTGFLTEAIAAYTYKYCIPAYYDVALGTKFVRDEESTEMMDLIFDSVVYDFGYIFDSWKGCTWTLPRMMGGNGSTDLASYWKGIEKTITKHYEDLYEAVAENG
ncbi:MAG: hypothetical protein E7631_06155 [Ruminococcaceae bacterium]|nr:hypothetical protein [Oscillospiraceae bacterium]